MVDAGIGRLLIASLHQGIADVLPARLPFYENWLTAPGLRSDKFGLAPLHAVLSFLRLEGQPAYDATMRKAGEYTAEWAYLELSAVQRTLGRMLPTALRSRWVLRLSRRLVSQTFRGSRTRVRVRRKAARVEIRGSIFCELRQAGEAPMCVFYAAAVERFLQRFAVGSEVHVHECKAAGASGCTLAVALLGATAAAPAAEAA